MAVTTTVSRNDYLGNGLAATFAYNFRVILATDLLVIKRAIATGVETTLAYPADYSVSGVGNASGGSITLLAGALSSAYALSIVRNQEIKQPTALPTNGAFFPPTHELALDRGTLTDQQQQLHIDRALKLPVSVSGISTELPVPVPGGVLVWNTNGTALMTVQVAGLLAALRPATFDPVSPLAVEEGVTLAAPAVTVRNSTGDILHPTLSYSILDTSKATVNPTTGAILGVAAGGTFLRITAENVYVDVPLTVQTNYDALKTVLLANGATSVRLFDRRYSAASTGASDVYGSGIALTVPATKTAPAFSTANGWTFNGATDMLSVASTSDLALDGSTSRGFYIAGSIDGTGFAIAGLGHVNDIYTLLQNNSGLASVVSESGNVSSDVAAATGTIRNAIVQTMLPLATTRRVVVDVDGRAAKMANGGNVTAATGVFSIGGWIGGGALNASVVKAAIYWTGELNATATAALRAWGIAQHGAVRQLSKTKAFVALGDSRTFGTGAGTPAADTWIARLAAANTSYDFSNWGIPSIRAETVAGAIAGHLGVTHNSARTREIFFLELGFNDIASFARTSTDVIGWLTTILDYARSLGYTKIVALPIMPAPGVLTSGMITYKDLVNAQLAAWVGTKVDVYCGTMAADAALADPGSGDHIHYTTTQYQTMANDIATDIAGIV